MTNDRRSFIKQAALTSGALLLPSACKTLGGRINSSDSYLKVSPINPDTAVIANSTVGMLRRKATSGIAFTAPGPSCLGTAAISFISSSICAA